MSTPTTFPTFPGKTALVTGASSGIGEAIANRLQAAGADVLRADIAPASPLHLDVTSDAGWRTLLAAIPKLDIVVHSAGIAHAKPVIEMDLDEWRRVLSINLDGAFLALRHCAPKMPPGSSIVLLGSASGVKVAAGASAYCASKAGLRMLAKTAALELKDAGIRINTVSPAGVATPMWSKMEFFQDLAAKQGEEAAWNAFGGRDPQVPALKRMAFPDEIADAILFLASDAAAGITAHDLVIDAGYTA